MQTEHLRQILDYIDTYTPGTPTFGRFYMRRCLVNVHEIVKNDKTYKLDEWISFMYQHFDLCTKLVINDISIANETRSGLPVYTVELKSQQTVNSEVYNVVDKQQYTFYHHTPLIKGIIHNVEFEKV